MCHTEMTRSRMKTPKKKTKDQQPLLGWMDVLVDMLLGFLSEGTQLWRCVVDQVFRMVAAHITPSAMELIVKVQWWEWSRCSGGSGQGAVVGVVKVQWWEY